ncbi:MAG: hypothetical protein GYA34_14620 [Chloroflexi bacterium]|nr:hypothetical protein [Chloroflexota bacterium]
MLQKWVVSLLVLGGICSACSTPQQTAMPSSTAVNPTSVTYTSTPLPLPTPTRTSMPGTTPTQIPATATSTPLTADLHNLIPTGKAAREWKGIPVMPNAFAGEEAPDGKSYRFATRGNTAAIQDYYTRQLALLGWSFVSAGIGDNGNQLVMFTKGRDVLSIAIISIDETERIVMVMLVLS